jgi:hypothetical protein
VRFRPGIEKTGPVKDFDFNAWPRRQWSLPKYVPVRLIDEPWPEESSSAEVQPTFTERLKSFFTWSIVDSQGDVTHPDSSVVSEKSTPRDLCSGEPSPRNIKLGA